jgi:hypothetical protein
MANCAHWLTESKVVNSDIDLAARLTTAQTLADGFTLSPPQSVVLTR